MGNLVIRLRKQNCKICDEAADEIERVYFELEECRKDRDDFSLLQGPLSRCTQERVTLQGQIKTLLNFIEGLTQIQLCLNCRNVGYCTCNVSPRWGDTSIAAQARKILVEVKE